VSGLELRDVVKHYGEAGELVRAVDGVSLRVAPGELVALYGPSGSGKTTLLLLAAGIEQPDAGEVRFGGRPLRDLTPAEHALHQRRSLGFVTQDAHLMPGVPAVENAALKLLADRVSLRDARRQAGLWLERVGLGSRLDHDPSRLSGGERQRVALARALVNEPPLVLADEPTGNLDSRRGAEILALLRSVCRERGAATLLVTHDPQAADVADRVLVLQDGRIAPRGTGTPLPTDGDATAVADSAGVVAPRAQSGVP
jgi:putative ABC transport system ATP-binding protein